MLPLLPFFLWNFTCFVLKRNRAVQIQIIDKMQEERDQVADLKIDYRDDKNTRVHDLVSKINLDKILKIILRKLLF